MRIDGDQAYRKVTIDNLKMFVEIFEKQFTAIYKQFDKYISIILYPCVDNYYSGFELKITNKKSDNVVRICESNTDLELLSKFVFNSNNDKLDQSRGGIYFEEDSFFIVKPHYYKYWHPAIAELDLADVIDQIMSASGGVMNQSLNINKLPVEVCQIIRDAVADSFDVGHPSFDLWSVIAEDLDGLDYDKEAAEQYFIELINAGPEEKNNFDLDRDPDCAEGDSNEN